MNGLLQDIRYALRQLRKNLGFTSVAVLTLALGIGANTAIFSVVNAVLVKPLPYKDADRLVVIWQQNPHRGWFENNVSGANCLDCQKQNHVFAEMAALDSNFFNVAGNAKPEEIAGERVSTNLFSVLGIQPLRGRLFLSEEERQEKAAVIVSYGLWQQHFGGDSSLVGKHISLNGVSYPIVGILPGGFSDDYSGSLGSHSQLWISGIQPFPEGREFHNYPTIARLKPGVTLAQAQAEMNTIGGRIEQQYPESKGWGVALVRMHDRVQIIRMVMREAGRLLLIGLAAGVAAVLIARRGAESLLFDLKPYDPIILLGSIALLAAVAAFASYHPARRAAKVDPMVALRYE